ncbi:MAG: YraN family protein [Candidatus Magasanikbacteria bacterium]|nr:YraN family protein [Candidatus Magasanikbacteria bacterium]
MSSERQRVGEWGESQACQFLVRHGFIVRERNYHSTQGEIDIVASRGGDYYFIEVKTRFTPELATDLAITPRKLYRFRKTVQHYCYRRGIGEEGSLIIAGLIVLVKRATRTISFRLAIYC